MLTRRTLLVSGLCAVASGCDSNTSPSTKAWNSVVGTACLGELALPIVDGYLDFDYEPMEWKRYGLRIHFWHDILTPQERSVARDGKWVDPNHRSVPNGFPILPSVWITVGYWPFGTQPLLSGKTKVQLNFRGFAGDGTSRITHSFVVSPQHLQLADNNGRFELSLQTSGERKHKQNVYSWSLVFRGLCYDDGWMLDPAAALRDY